MSENSRKREHQINVQSQHTQWLPSTQVTSQQTDEPEKGPGGDHRKGRPLPIANGACARGSYLDWEALPLLSLMLDRCFSRTVKAAAGVF